MSKQISPIIYGEVLFDCFPGGEQVLGGAPFNVAWHLQAMGLNPLFISRVGNDQRGQQISDAMAAWGMKLDGLQQDSDHPTGVVQVTIEDNEPSYEIVTERAYDYISEQALADYETDGLLYHGTLALRNPTSANTLAGIKKGFTGTIFMDVNLRTPWWDHATTHTLMGEADWVKLNHDELHQLGFESADIIEAGEVCLKQFGLTGLLMTLGEKGACVLTESGECHSITPQASEHFVDTVGAGDAFTSVFLAGLLKSWPLEQIMNRAQHLASAIVGIRGALPRDKGFYKTDAV